MLDAIVSGEVPLEIVDAGKVLDPVNFSVDPVSAGLSVVDPDGGTADEPAAVGRSVETKTDEVVEKIVSKSGVLKNNNNKKSSYLPLLTQVLLL